MNEKDKENAQKLADIIHAYAITQSWTKEYTLELLKHLVQPILQKDLKQEIYQILKVHLPNSGLTEEQIEELTNQLHTTIEDI